MQRRRGIRKSRLRIAVPVTGLAGMLFLTGCGLDTIGSGDAAASASPVAGIDCARAGQIRGSGSTAQQNAMDYWTKEYRRACSPVQVVYNPLGSGAGVAQFMRGGTAFGGTDTPVDPAKDRPAEGVCPGGQVINLPMVGGPIALGYNVPGVEDLVLDAPTIAKIFDSRITSWDDPVIRELNPDAQLPPLAIRAVHRSDTSGTTQNFQAYLAGAAPEVWSHPAEKAWHGRGGDSADGSDGVASTVNSSAGSIGYFELSFAKKLRMTTVRIDTGASEPVTATTETASAGIAAAKVAGKGHDLTLKFDYRTSAEGTYPLVLASYQLVCDQGNVPESLPALKSFLTYTASEEGQEPLARLHYAPLPDSVTAEVRRVVSTLS